MSKLTLQQNQSLASLIFPNNKQITDAHSEPCQTFLKKTSSKMFDKVLNTPLDYLSWFIVVLSEIYGKVDIC